MRVEAVVAARRVQRQDGVGDRAGAGAGDDGALPLDAASGRVEIRPRRGSAPTGCVQKAVAHRTGGLRAEHGGTGPPRRPLPDGRRTGGPRRARGTVPRRPGGSGDDVPTGR
ncbi:hypothetical protein [Streptomyces sp. XY152]|uniref:hypothetical protein n=1 Tax=Streptomyces sp. XY152 TaxID=1415560 RepID=UPI0006ADF167|nr:hypothetical protein [Streptomyces sp. XY152]KOV36285.1 hypothetical protein ADK58_00155 [Streptomyces sp. XY152]